MRKERREIIITDAIEIQKGKKPTRIEYYEQIYANKLDNLEKVNKFLGTYCLPKISQDETDNLNRPVTLCEVESVLFLNP